MARRQLSAGRKATYYIGCGVLVLGLLLFLVPFLIVPLLALLAIAFNGRVPEEAMGFGFAGFGIFAITGFVTLCIGVALMIVGRAGLAGSGVVLDPEQARRDVEPWARMSGGVVSDAADEAGVHLDRIGERLSGDPDLPFDEKLRRLHRHYEEGLITEQEYEAEKARILESA